MNFSPSVYEHAAKIINKSPWEVSRNSDLLYRAHADAYRMYHHSPIVVGIDIYNLEAQAYGSIIHKPSDNNLPAISEFKFNSISDIINLNLFDPAKDGRLPLVIDAGKKLKNEFPDADVRIPVSGPYSIASNLIGFDALLCETIDQTEQTRNALVHLVNGQIRFCKKIINNGLNITFFESAATPPLLSPQLFHDVDLPALKILLQKCREIAGHSIPCIIGGDTAPIIEMILEIGTTYVICPSETDQALFMEKMKSFPNVIVRINMNPEIISTGDMNTVFTEVNRVMKLAEDRTNVCIGTGVLPYETNPDVVLKISEYINSND